MKPSRMKSRSRRAYRRNQYYPTCLRANQIPNQMLAPINALSQSPRTSSTTGPPSYPERLPWGTGWAPGGERASEGGPNLLRRYSQRLPRLYRRRRSDLNQHGANPLRASLVHLVSPSSIQASLPPSLARRLSSRPPPKTSLLRPLHYPRTVRRPRRRAV